MSHNVACASTLVRNTAMASNPLAGGLEAIVASFGPEREHPPIMDALVSGDFQIDFFRSK